LQGSERVRRVAAVILVVVGAVGLVVSSVGIWLERSFLDTGRFTSTANTILDESAVQHELTVVLVRQLSHAAGADLQIAEPFLASVVTQVVDSSAFRAVFDRAVSTSHRVLVDADTGRIVLDLTGAYDQIKGPLQQVAPKLAAQLPSRRQLDFVLLHRSQLTTAWDVIGRVKRAVEIITIGSIVLLAAGIALARERWRALARAAWITAGGLAVLGLVLVVGRIVLEAQITDSGVADAAGASFRVITRPLLVQSVVLGTVAVGIAFGARFTDRHGRAAWVPTARGWWAWLQGALPRPADGRDGAPAPVGAGAAAAAFTHVRLPKPRVESRSSHAWRAAALVVLGLFAVFDPGGVVTVLVVAVGIAVLYLAVTEGIAAVGSQRVERQ
jgi:hypothetical protein